MTKDVKKRLKNIVYVDEKDFEGEEELCNALVAFIGRWKKKKIAECEKQRQEAEDNLAAAQAVIELWEYAGEGNIEDYDKARDLIAEKISPIQDEKEHYEAMCNKYIKKCKGYHYEKLGGNT